MLWVIFQYLSTFLNVNDYKLDVVKTLLMCMSFVSHL